MTKLRFEHDLAMLERDLGKLGPCVIERAAPPAVNKVVRSVNSVAVKAVSRETGIKQKDVRGDMRMKFARRGDLNAHVDAAAGKARNLAAFVTPAQRRPAEGAGNPQFFRKRSRSKAGGYLRPGVKAKAWNRPKVYGGTFIGRGKNGNVIVLKRKGAGRRSKLKGVVGPSVRREFMRPPVQAEMAERATERFPVEMDRAIAQQIKRCIPRRR